MKSVRQKDTRPEIVVRKVLHSLGYRFRLHRRDLPGRPDIVLPRHRAVVLVHGCFWHQHERCGSARIPRTRTDYWADKLNGNVARDMRVEAALSALGWRVLTVWECDVDDLKRLECELERFLAPKNDVRPGIGGAPE